MTERLQQQTLSVRIDGALRRRLEELRGRRAERTGRPLSMSDIAKSLLESVDGPEIEVADLLADPTGALLTMRRKREGGMPLTRAEWTVFAFCVQEGLESDAVPSSLSRQAVVAVLDAFASVYDLLRSRASALNATYVENLPTEYWALSNGRCGGDKLLSEDVRRTVAETRQWLQGRAALPVGKLRIGRNLHLLLSDEEFVGAEDVHAALVVYWSALWPLAARGHYALTGRPVRARLWPAEFEGTPAQFSRGLALSVERDDELCAVVSFPGVEGFGVVYRVARYPELREFRTMVEVLGEGAREWNGGYFSGYVDRQVGVRFRRHTDGISVGCALGDWARLRALLDEAWRRVDVRSAWERLGVEYGDL